jgi:hypothetical protein
VKDISRQYALLTADERFQLFVQAMGRKDEQELDRLENTCPRLQYSAKDHDYTWRKMRFITYALATALQQLRTELLATTALMLAFANDDAEHEDAETKALDAFRKLMRVRNGRRAGWHRFCDQIGADPVAIAAPFVENVEWAMHAADAVCEALQSETDQASGNERTAADVAMVEFEALTEAWRSEPKMS